MLHKQVWNNTKCGILNYRLFSAVASLLIAVLVFSSMAPAVYGETISGADMDILSEEAGESDDVSIYDVYYYPGLAAGSATAGIVAGGISGSAVASYLQTMLAERAIATVGSAEGSRLALMGFLTGESHALAASAGYEGIGAYSAASGMAGAGGLAAGIAIGLAVAGIIFLIGYLCY